MKKKPNELAEARRDKKAREDKLRTVSSLKQAISKIDELEAHVEAIKSLKLARADTRIMPRQGENKSEATAFAIATDWHLGSVISPEQVNGLNKYDVSIAKQRIKRFFQGVVSLTDKERQNVKISELVLFLGGDLIEGALHLDTIMTNEIAEPINQAVVVQGLVEEGLIFLLNHGRFERITVVCCDGNHGRVTHKQHWSSRQGNALEWYMYYNIASRFPQLNWILGPSIHQYVDVYNYSVRFHHGDTIHFGGVNGPYTYLNRRVFQWNEARMANYSVQGHLHCYTIGTRRWLINGALVGHNAYAISLGGEFQPPIQAFFLMDKKRGVTVQIPILVGG